MNKFMQNKEENREAPYFQAAKAALINWCGMSQEEAEQKIQTESRAAIEKQTGAHGSVYDAATRIAKEFSLDEKQTVGFINEVLGKTKETEMTELIKGKIETIKNNPYVSDLADRLEAKLALETCDAIHKGWTGRNSTPFFGAKDAKDQQYQYTPSEFIGWGEVKADLLFLKPVADSVGLNIDEASMKELYAERVVDYLEKVKEIAGPGIEGVGGPGVDTIVELIDVIDNLENGNKIMLSDEIAFAWENDPELVIQIAHEVYTKGIGADLELMNKLQEQGVLSKDDPSGLDYFEQEK